MSNLKDRKIIVGVTGSIAAYKSCELVRNLIKKEAEVQVVMTNNASKFITPLTLQTLSGKRVANDAFDLEWESKIGHIHLADSSDLIIVAPASASFIGKLANGITDNLLSTVIVASKAKVIVCPAMNVNMYSNTLVKENIKKLKNAGYKIIEPYEGDLACGWEGKGRLADIEDISTEIEKELSPKDLKGKKILITAGATREFVDPVRFISNPSSGKMGYSIARAAWMRGGNVTLITGFAEIPPPYGVNTIKVESADEMYKAVMSKMEGMDVIIKAAAVSDYKSSGKKTNKIKKSAKSITLELTKTKDILKEIGNQKNGTFLVGFAAESENISENSEKKLKSKNLDLIVANDIKQEGAGFGTDTNIVKIISKDGKKFDLPLMAKEKFGHEILNFVVKK